MCDVSHWYHSYRRIEVDHAKILACQIGDIQRANAHEHEVITGKRVKQLTKGGI
jgi:hypothetical protein